MFITTWPATTCMWRARSGLAGHHELRFEFEVTGKPDFANGKGTPGRAQLYIDGPARRPGGFPPLHAVQARGDSAESPSALTLVRR